MGQLKSGLARPIAVSGSKRLAALPDVPTAEELGLKDYNAGSWFGIYGPEKMDPATVARLNSAFNQVLGSEKIRQGVLNAGMYVSTMTPAELAAYTAGEFANWGKIMRQNGIKLD